MNNTFPQTEINVEALENVKTRLFQLQESILFFLRSINPDTTPSNISWTDLHSKFNVLMAKYSQLTNTLKDHNLLLQSSTVFPFETPATDQQVQSLSVLLRTKLTPELEQEEEDRLQDGQIPGLSSGGSGGGNADERRILQALKIKIATHDAVCGMAFQVAEGIGKMINPRARFASDDDEDGDDDDEDDEESDEDGEDQDTDKQDKVKASKAQHSSSTSDPSAPSSSAAAAPVPTATPAPLLKVDEILKHRQEFERLNAAQVTYRDDWGGTFYLQGMVAEDQEDENLSDLEEEGFADDESEVEMMEYYSDDQGMDEDEVSVVQKARSKDAGVAAFGTVDSTVQGVDDDDEDEDAYMVEVAPSVLGGPNVGAPPVPHQGDDDMEQVF